MNLQLTKKYSMEQLLIFIISIFTFGIIGSKTIRIFHITIYLEISAVFMILFILFRLYKLYKMRNQKEEYINFFEENKVFTIVILGFSILTIINSLIMAPNGFIYAMNKVIPFIALFFLMVYLRNENKEIIKKYLKFSAYIFIISFLLAIGMYLLGYTNGAFSLTKGIKLVPFSESFDLYGEVRLYWLLSHKSRFVIYCAIGYIFILCSEIKNNYIKTAGIVLSFICVLLSNSMTGLAIYGGVFLVGIIVKFRIIEKIMKSKYKNIIIGTITISITMGTIILIILVAGKRDLSTLGSRTFIWKAGIEQFLNNPFGVIAMPDDLWIKTYYEGQLYYFSNGHNGYLNELIENGALVGLLYLILNVNMVIKFLQKKKWIFSSLLVLYSVIFLNLESVNAREMNYILFLSYGIIYYLDNEKEPKIKRR